MKIREAFLRAASLSVLATRRIGHALAGNSPLLDANGVCSTPH
jgi:hypothetical protein